MEGRKIKFISTILIFIFMFNYFVMLSPVLAISSTTEKNQKYLNNMMELIPDEIELDVTEAEYEQADEEILDKIKVIWDNEGVDIENISISVSLSRIHTGINEFGKASINLQYSVGGAVSKVFNLKLNNSNSFNNVDEEYVKNLNITNDYRYFAVDAQCFKESGITRVKNFETKLSTYFTNLINDNSIKVVVDSPERRRKICYTRNV